MGSNDAIAITGIAVTFVVSVANLVYSLRTNQRTIFVNTVTSSRLKWIDSLRDKVSEFIAVSARLAESTHPSGEVKSITLQRDTLFHQIVLHLNPLDEEDQKIKTLADHVCELATHHDRTREFPVALAELRDVTGAYLKKEWNRVKAESKGKLS
jgi:hypothetical protein